MPLYINITFDVFYIIVLDQIGTLSQVGTSSYMAYAM